MSNVFYVTLHELEDEQKLLTDEFNKIKQNIMNLEVDMNKMKNNLNALSGAIQQTDKLIAVAKKHGNDGDWKVEEKATKAKGKKNK